MIGRTFGNFRIVEKLGDGGMGTVYRAHDEMLDRYVALKVLKPELARQAALMERFRHEAIALARLNHPRIAALHGMERHGEELVMVMEFITGETLEAIIHRSGRVAWTRACELCIGILEALDHAHDKGVVHRDIKPANAMLTREGSIKVMDFGIARLRDKNRQTRVGHAVGTPMYMSPEQLRGEEVDGRADLYAVGTVLFELVTGQMAFEADSDYALMMKQLNDPPPLPSTIVPEVPPAVDAIVATAMAKRPEERYANAAAMRDALQRALGVQRGARPSAPVAATRLAAEPPSATADHAVPVAGPPATRLAGVAQPAAETRLSTDATPTRLANTGRTLDGPPSDAEGVVPWAKDWRTWVAAAGLLIAIGLTVRTFRRSDPPPAPPAREQSVAAAPGGPADSVVAAMPPSPPAAEPVTPPETKQTLPPTAGTAPVVVSGGGRAVPPANVRTRGGSGAGPSEAPPNPKATEKAKDTAPSPGTTPVPLEPPPPPTPEKARDIAPAVEPSDDRAAAAIAAALDRFASDVSGGNVGAVQPVLRGEDDLVSRFLTVMREGRVALSVVGEPAIDVQGARASARFGTWLNVRSAFGGNRRRAVPFSAELARSGGEWRVVSVRPAGSIDLR